MKTIVIFGGAGFVGRNIIRNIAKDGHNIIVPYQQNTDEPKLKILGSLGQVVPFRYKTLSELSVISALRKADTVINLKTLWSEKKTSYRNGIFNFNKNLLKSINTYNNKSLYIYFSGLGIDNYEGSRRASLINETEKMIINNNLKTVIIRPGIIIGGGDEFMKRLIPIFRMSLVIPIFGSGNTKIQPVFIEDISLALKKIVNNKLKQNNIFELGGPIVFSYKHLYKFISKNLGIRRLYFRIPFFVSMPLVYILEKTPFSPLTRDQLLLFKKDNLVSNNNKNFDDLEIKPQNTEEIIKKIIKNI